MRAHSTIFFDSECNLCTSWVRFVIDRDPDERFKFASLERARAELLTHDHSVNLDDKDSVVVIDEHNQMIIESDAAFFVLSKLKSPLRHLSHLSIIPRPLRDSVYRIVAKYRYKIFGKNKSCYWSPKYQNRMLEPFGDLS